MVFFYFVPLCLFLYQPSELHGQVKIKSFRSGMAKHTHAQYFGGFREQSPFQWTFPETGKNFLNKIE
jgi:hypothetical protein